MGLIKTKCKKLKTMKQSGTLKKNTNKLERKCHSFEIRWWHHRLDGQEFEQAPRVGDRQGSLAWGCPWGHKESDTTERLTWTDINYIRFYTTLNIGVKLNFSQIHLNLFCLSLVNISFLKFYWIIIDLHTVLC